LASSEEFVLYAFGFSSSADAPTHPQELLEHFEPFLAEFLLTWNGEPHRPVIFDLIALLKPLEYDCAFLILSLPTSLRA
jgi:hypothetical protein